MAKSKMTIDELKEMAPELIEQIEKSGAEKLATEIARASIDKLAEKFPALVKAITAKATESLRTTPVNLKIDGFFIDIKDPFGLAAARKYAKTTAAAVSSLPMVLPYETKDATTETLRDYYLRANGAGDKVRSAKAADALKKLGVDIAAKVKKL